MATPSRRDDASRLSLGIIGLDAVGSEAIREVRRLALIAGAFFILLAVIVGLFGSTYALIFTAAATIVGGGKAVGYARRRREAKRLAVRE